MTAPVDTSAFDGLEQFCTVRQLEYLAAIRKHGSITAAAKALKIDQGGLSKSLQALRGKAAAHGFSPEHGLTHGVAPGLRVKGTSQLVDNRTGEQMLTWVKADRDGEATERLVREMVEAMTESVRGTHPPTAAPAHSHEDLLTVYPMGDPHFGMYAWAKESGDDFDLGIADRITREAIDRLVDSAPASRTALLLNLGDFFHADDSTNRTPASGNSLDVDTRYALVMQTGLKALLYCVDRLLAKHETVHLWMMPGNHDPHMSQALPLCLWAYYHSNPRVVVDMGAGLFKYMEFGSVLLGSTHGHGPKMADLPLLMAADQSQAWGRTQHRYWYCGHVHHMSRDKEHPGVVVETFRTLAPKDAWHAGQGYRAGRDMYAITHHRQHGEIMRTRCDIGLLKSGK